MSARVPDLVVIEEEDERGAASSADAAIMADDGDGEDLPAGLTEKDGAYSFALTRPVKLVYKSATKGDRVEVIDALPIRRLTGGDMRAMMTSGRSDGGLLLLELAVMMPELQARKVLDKLDAADLMRAMGVIGFLSGGSRPTGR